MNTPTPRHEAPDRRRPAHHGMRQAVARLRLAEARAVDVNLQLAVEITAGLDHLVECLRRGLAEISAHPARTACPCCGCGLLVTVADGICTVEGRE